MGKIISPAGSSDFRVKKLQREGGNFVISGRMMSAWDVKVQLTLSEIIPILVRAVPLTFLILGSNLKAYFKKRPDQDK